MSQNIMHTSRRLLSNKSFQTLLLQAFVQHQDINKMEIPQCFQDIIDLINNVLENDANIDKSRVYICKVMDSRWIEITMNSTRGICVLPIHLRLIGTDIFVDIGDLTDVFEWSLKDGENNNIEALAYVNVLLTSHILYEKYGKYKNRLIFFNKLGEIALRKTVYTGLTFAKNSHSILWPPIVENNLTPKN
jgi:hypothetical protein